MLEELKEIRRAISGAYKLVSNQRILRKLNKALFLLDTLIEEATPKEPSQTEESLQYCYDCEYYALPMVSKHCFSCGYKVTKPNFQPKASKESEGK
jgi:uncharacterized paraquat-inducible protein A